MRVHALENGHEGGGVGGEQVGYQGTSEHYRQLTKLNLLSFSRDFAKQPDDYP